MKRIKLVLEYDGTGFAGWQIQPGERTVQGELQSSLSRMMGTGIRVVGSGRTDAGVHALAQVAHADVTRDIPPANIMMGLNSDLPRDIRVLDCQDTDARFHAQRSAVGKQYRYTILNSKRPTALNRHRVWHIRHPLNVEDMKMAARHLIGEHDFFSFKSAGDNTTTVRDLRQLEIDRAGEHIVLAFEASGFLKHMVRNITGALVEVGKGRLTPGDIHRLMLLRSRENAPSKAPPQGLTLVEVTY